MVTESLTTLGLAADETLNAGQSYHIGRQPFPAAEVVAAYTAKHGRAPTRFRVWPLEVWLSDGRHR